MVETVKCIFCDNTRLIKIFQQHESKIYRCVQCGLIFRWPQPTRSQIQDFYDQQEHLENPYFTGLKKNYSLDNPAVKLYRRELERIDRFLSPGKILDIGCAYGVFLDLARLVGWQVCGVEVSKVSSDYARRKFSLSVFTGTLEEAKFASNSFDLITLWDVAEHLTDPIKTFQEIYRVLKPNSYLLILTIDVNSLTGRLANFSDKTKDFLYDIQHNYFFSHQTLKKFLLKTGFSQIKILDTAGAQISRWHSRSIPSILSLGTDCLDALAKIIHQEYRQIVIARKQ